MGLPDLFEQAVRHTGGIVAGIGDDRWGDPTPCEAWDVREVVQHLVDELRWTVPLAEGRTIEEVGDRLDGDLLGGAPAKAFEEAGREAVEAVRRPGVLTSPTHVSYGPIPGAVYLGHLLNDLVVHGWDLARATGQETAIPGELADACWAIMAPQVQLVEGSGVFGPSLDIADGADVQTALLALEGRRA